RGALRPLTERVLPEGAVMLRADRDAMRVGSGPDAPRSCQFRATKASTVTFGCPTVPSTLTRQVCAAAVVDLTATIRAVWDVVDLLRLTVPAATASKSRCAPPLAESLVDTQATWRKPLKESA